MSSGGDASMEREASYLAHRVCEGAVCPAVRQGLQGKHLAALLWPHCDAIRNGPLLRVPAPAALVSPFTSTSEQLIHRRFRVGIHAMISEVAVFGITHQPALALQIPGDALSDGMSELSEILAGWRLDPAKPRTGSMRAIDVDSIQ